MKYRVSFEFESESDPQDWYWKELLNRIESGDDRIDWSTFTLEKESGWESLPLDTL